MPLSKRSRPAAFLLATLCTSSAVAAGLAESSGTYSCSYNDFSRCSEGSARVTLLDGKVQSVSFDSKFCATKARPAASCKLDIARGGADKWEEKGRTVSVTFIHPRFSELTDVFAVSVEDGQIVLDFGETQPSTKCKPAGELPERLVIAPQAEKCRVEF